MYILGFNGPPQSGKDTASQMMFEILREAYPELPIVQVNLSTPLRQIASAMTGYVIDDSNYEAFKIKKFQQFGDKTGRQLMIDVSESFLKPTYGPEILAKMLLDDLGSFDGLVLLRDTGFQTEATALSRASNVKNIEVIQVERPGTSFKWDSRGWVTSPRGRCIYNDSDLAALREQVNQIADGLTTDFGWKL